MLERLTVLISLVLFSIAFATPAHACGVHSNCVLGDRHYRIRMPAEHDGKTPVGALIFVHGYKGNARGYVRSNGIAAMGQRMNAAIISVKSSGNDWAIPNAPTHSTRKSVDELAYFDRVVADAARRFPIDTTRIVVIGSSAGAMMTWTLACHRGDRYAGFIPVAGTFWAPVPDTCTSPASSVVHIHGTRDAVVPLKGRRIGDTRQGDVRAALTLYGQHGGFGEREEKRLGKLTCTNRRNADGHILNFCLFDGGHTFNIGYVQYGLDMLKAAGKL